MWVKRGLSTFEKSVIYKHYYLPYQTRETRINLRSLYVKISLLYKAHLFSCHNILTNVINLSLLLHINKSIHSSMK